VGYLIPAGELTIDDIISLRTNVISKLFDVATRLTGLGRDELVVRSILPATDLGLSNETWEASISTANNWNPWISNQLEDQRFIVIYGLANLSADPITTAIRFSTGANKTKTIDVIQYEDLYTNKERVDGYFNRYIIYKHKQYLNADLYARATGTERLVLKGLTVEPAGRITF